MAERSEGATGKVVVAGTLDTKRREVLFVRDRIAAAGLPTLLIDIGIRSDDDAADVTAAEVAVHHPDGPSAVFVDDRGDAVVNMAIALERFLLGGPPVVGMIGLGGSGGTGMIAPAMRALPVGLPKVMVSTLASGDVSDYVGASDMFMHHPITDIAGMNSVLRRVLANAADAMVGMVSAPPLAGEADKPALGLTMFGVTTPCVTRVADRLEADFDCLIFHATGTGGRAMEHLADAGELAGILDLTTTEICDFLLGGVLSAGEDRLGAAQRRQIPYVGACGALDMINFWSLDSLPERFRQRRLHRHNAQVTLVRTTADDCSRIGRWIGHRLNAFPGPVEFLLPLRGLSALDIEGGVFHDPEANAALFDALRTTVNETETRTLREVDAHINDPAFAGAVIEAFARVRAL